MSNDTRFSSLYEEHRRAVLAYCLRRTNRRDAEDAAAEVFATAWRRIDDVPAEMALAWFYGVARRVLSRQYRSRTRLTRLRAKLGSQGMPPVPDPETEVVQRIEYRRVHEALNRLRHQDREILLLAAWEGLSNAEIGAALDCTPEAAAQRLHRARRRLEEGARWPGRAETEHDTPVERRGGETA
jgi:RNA polymerase sigma-70 factor, ECF subfamily